MYRACTAPVDEMCMTWLYRSTSISFSTFTLPLADTCNPVQSDAKDADTRQAGTAGGAMPSSRGGPAGTAHSEQA